MEGTDLIPILYAENETDFNHNGLGALYGTIECLVTEERNGAFELELVYPVDGVLAKEITEFKFIMAKPNDVDDPHSFRIYEIGKNLEDGNITVYAATKTNDLGANLLEHVVVENVTAEGAMNAIRDNLIEPTNYMFISDIQTLNSGEWANQNPLSAIAGEEGSILSKWGGEIKRTNDAIYLYGRRGTDKISVIRPGKNILGFNMVVSTKGMTTGLIPIATYTPKDTDVPYTIRGTQVNSPLASNYPVHYLAMKDYSSYDIWPEEQQDEEGNPIPMSDAEFRAAARVNLNNTAASYFSVQNPGSDKPKITSTIDLLLLSDSDEYAKYKNLEHISLTDTVEVYVEQFDVDIEIKVNKLVYDSLKEQVRKIEAGSARYTMYSDVQKTYQDQVDKVKEYISTVESGIYNTIALTADENNRIFRGYTTPDPSLVREEDLWFKPVANGEVEMYRYTDGAWVLAVTNADKIVIGTLDASAVNVVNINADNIATGSITGPNGEWDLNTGTLYLGSSYTNASFKWDGSSLIIAQGALKLYYEGIEITDASTDILAKHMAAGAEYIRKSTGNPIASYAADGANLDQLTAVKIYSPHVANKLSAPYTAYVDTAPTGDGSGRDASNKASSLDRALQTALDGAMVIEEGVTVYVSGKITEALRLKGFSGGGRIIVQGRGQITGQISVINCSCRVDFNLLDVVRPDISATAALISVVNSCDVRVNGCRLDGYSVGTGIGAYYGGGVYVTDCDIVKCEYAYDASVNARIAQVGCRGANNLYVGNSALGSNIVLSDTRPIATNIKRETAGGVITDASSTGQTSTFAATPATWQTVSKTFTGRLSTANHATGYVWKTGTWTQGTWEGTAQRGYADFGTSIKDWLDSAGGYQNISSVIIKARRNATSGGGSVSLKIASPSAQSLPAVARGGTSQASLVSGLVAAMTSGALKLSSSTTATADYAGFDRIEIIITADKKA